MGNPKLHSQILPKKQIVINQLSKQNQFDTGMSPLTEVNLKPGPKTTDKKTHIQSIHGPDLKPLYSRQSNQLKGTSESTRSSLSTVSCYSEEALMSPRQFLKSKFNNDHDQTNLLTVLFEEYKSDPSAVYKKIHPVSPATVRSSASRQSPKIKTLNKTSTRDSTAASSITSKISVVEELKKSLVVSEKEMEEERKLLIQMEVNKQLELPTNSHLITVKPTKSPRKFVYKPLEEKIKDDVILRLSKLYEKLDVLKNTDVMLPEIVEEEAVFVDAEEAENVGFEENLSKTHQESTYKPLKSQISKADKLLGTVPIASSSVRLPTEQSHKMASIRGLFKNWGHNHTDH